MNSDFFITGKSTVNFCEPDIYYIGIGEPLNVLSSIVIVFFGLYGLYNVNYRFIKDSFYSIPDNKIKFNVLFSLLAMIGLGSMYFHSKLRDRKSVV